MFWQPTDNTGKKRSMNYHVFLKTARATSVRMQVAAASSRLAAIRLAYKMARARGHSPVSTIETVAKPYFF